MGLDYVDLYLIHSPQGISDLAQTWTEFEGLERDGLAKSIGVSNFAVKDLERLMKQAKITPAVNQISFSPYQLREMSPVLEYCKEHGIVIEAYSALAPITKLPNGPVDEPVRKAAERLNATPAQILLSWAQQKGCVIVTTSSKRERLEEYLGVADLPPLTDAEIRAIDEAGLQEKPTSLLGKAREGVRSTVTAMTVDLTNVAIRPVTKAFIVIVLVIQFMATWWLWFS